MLLFDKISREVNDAQIPSAAKVKLLESIDVILNSCQGCHTALVGATHAPHCESCQHCDDCQNFHSLESRCFESRTDHILSAIGPNPRHQMTTHENGSRCSYVDNAAVIRWNVNDVEEDEGNHGEDSAIAIIHAIKDALAAPAKSRTALIMQYFEGNEDVKFNIWTDNARTVECLIKGKIVGVMWASARDGNATPQYATHVLIAKIEEALNEAGQ